jgi:hypothetical protein
MMMIVEVVVSWIDGWMDVAAINELWVVCLRRNEGNWEGGGGGQTGCGWDGETEIGRDMEIMRVQPSER